MNHLFPALSDPTRRKILDMLKKKDLTAGEIADAFSISKPSISHHLDILKRANLVVPEKQGQFITYSINTTELDELLKWVYRLGAKRKNKSSIKIVSYETTQQEERSSYMAYSFIAIHLCFYCLEQTSRPGANALQCKR